MPVYSAQLEVKDVYAGFRIFFFNDKSCFIFSFTVQSSCKCSGVENLLFSLLSCCVLVLFKKKKKKKGEPFLFGSVNYMSK